MKAVLILLALALTGVLTWQWTTWPQEPTDADGVPGEALAPGGRVEDEDPLARLRPLDDREEYHVVVDRPLFSPTRRPPDDEPEQEEPEVVTADGSLDKIDLSAVLITPEETLAWVMDASSREVRRLRLGDEVEGWAVRDILSDRLVLERQGQTNTLVLRDYARQPPPPVRPRPPVRTPARNQPTPQRPARPAGNPQAQDDATPSESTPPP